MPETVSRIEREYAPQLSQQVREVFERRATRGERKLILETYKQKFEQLITTMPKEQQDTTMVNIQRFLVKIGGYFSEYSARFEDFVRNIFVWPMIAASKDFPKDKYYQIELARAKAWGEFARDTTKTATAERMAYRDNFLPSAFIGAEWGGATGTFIGATLGGVASGATKGALVGGLQGAAIGAAAGGALGAAVALTMRIKDRILGPPVLYYSLFTRGGASVSAGTSSNSGSASAGVAMGG